MPATPVHTSPSLRERTGSPRPHLNSPASQFITINAKRTAILSYVMFGLATLLIIVFIVNFLLEFGDCIGAGIWGPVLTWVAAGLGIRAASQRAQANQPTIIASCLHHSYTYTCLVNSLICFCAVIILVLADCYDFGLFTIIELILLAGLSLVSMVATGFGFYYNSNYYKKKDQRKFDIENARKQIMDRRIAEKNIIEQHAPNSPITENVPVLDPTAPYYQQQPYAPQTSSSQQNGVTQPNNKSNRCQMEHIAETAPPSYENTMQSKKLNIIQKC